MKRKVLYLSLLLLLVLVQAAQAMSSENYALDWMIPLTNGGGRGVGSAHYQVNSTLGQTAVGEASSASYAVRLGFWQPFGRNFHVWLPLILR